MSVQLSVIIVTHNHEHEISDCIRGLQQNCRIRPIEILVTDNASQDKTAACMAALKETMASDSLQLHVRRNDRNLGFTRGVNQGLIQARGQYVLLLNPDTIIQPGSLELLAAFLTDSLACGAVAPQLRFADGEIQPSCRRFPRYRYLVFELLGLSRLFSRSSVFNGWKMGDFDHQSPREVDQPQGSCLMMPRAVLAKVPELDPRFFLFFSDVDLCRQIKQLGFKIQFLSAARVMHSKGGSIYENRPNTIWWSHLDFIRYFLKWYRPPLQWLFNLTGIPFLFLLGLLRWCVHRMARMGSS